MTEWVIQYWGDGGLCGKVVAADSKSSALALSRVPLPRVMKITRRRLLSADGFAALLSPRPSAKTQMLFLARALALFASGSVSRINELVVSLPELKRLAGRRLQALRDDLELSAKLQHLGFGAEIVSIIEAGEKTGKLTQALETALTYLKQNIEVEQKNSKQFMFGALLIVVSLSMFFSLPLLLSEPIDTLRNLRDVQVNMTPATYVLLFVSTMVRDYWWLLCAGGGAALFTIWRCRRLLLRVPPFNLFGSLGRIRRSIYFLIVWRAFRVAGIPLEGQTATLRAALGSDVSAQICERLKHGEALTDTLDQRFFSPTLTLATVGLSQVGIESFLKIVDILLVSLYEEQQARTSQAAAAMYTLGAVLSLATVAMLAFGLIFPIMSASAGGT